MWLATARGLGQRTEAVLRPHLTPRLRVPKS